MCSYLPPATKLGQGYVFTRVCDYVHGGGGVPHCMMGYTPKPGIPLGPEAGTPPPRDQRQAPLPLDQAPPSAVHAGRYGQQAGGRHPTGMQSCYSYDIPFEHRLHI